MLAAKGMAFAIADGVSGNGGGREAAEYTIRGVLSDYYATPETWEIPYALEKVLAAVNRWLLAQRTSQREFEGMVSTLSLIVLRGHRSWITHVGDTRIYRLRDQRLQQLTSDHVWERPDMQHVLKRAVGLDQHLAADRSEHELKVEDIFLLATDGVWEALGDKRQHELLLLHQDPQRAAQELVREALAHGSQDNATALVVRVTELPGEDWPFHVARELPLPPRLKSGDRIDGFIVEELLHDSRETLLYKVRAASSGQALVLKTLQPYLRDDRERCDALLAEEWLAKRVVAHYFPQVIACNGDSRRFLYYVMTYHPGATLEQRLSAGHQFTVPEVIQTGIRLCKGLSALHRLHVLHRDIKPANLHSGEDGKLRILDFSVALDAGSFEGAFRGTNGPAAGTPSFLAPELFDSPEASVQSDLYAAGVTLYYLLTRKYPYGEVEPFQHPRFGEPAPASRLRPDIPQWLDDLLLKAVSRERKDRFETAEEFQLALERGQQGARRRRAPLAERNPIALWQGIAAASVTVNVLLIYFYFAT